MKILKRVSLLCLFSFLVMELSFGQSPTVNGQFYGDGDNDIYEFWHEGTQGSKIYIYYPVPGGDPNLYVALVVDRRMNDNVFAKDRSGSGNGDYMLSAEWHDEGDDTKPIYRSAGDMLNSEFAGFTLTCGDGTSWSWDQGYSTGAEDGSDPDSWISDVTSGASPETDGHTFQSSSSIVWNMKNYANRWNSDTELFDLLDGDPDGKITDPNAWKSPFEEGAASDTDVTAIDGYPDTGAGDITYSSTYEWEWSMVYEWSVDLVSACGSNYFEVLNGEAHHSPSKQKRTETMSDPGPVADWGDLPQTYETDSTGVSDTDPTVGGARHLILADGNPFLGSVVDADPEGVPTTDTKGDDVSDGADDEDGVTFLDPLIPGETARIEVVAGTSGFLSAFIDFDNDGTLETVDFTTASGPTTPSGTFGDTQLSSGTYIFNITVPSDADNTIYSRFRFTQNSGDGGNSTTGEASSGEVEDYKTVNLVVSQDDCFRTLSVPYQDATYNDMIGSLWTQGVTGSDHPPGPDSNVFVWDNTTTASDESGWISSGIDLTTVPTAGSGFLMSIFSDDDYTGPEAPGWPKGALFPDATTHTSNVDVTSLLNSNAEGWALLGNPFSDPIDFSSLPKTGLTNVAYVYDRNAGGTTGGADGAWISTSGSDGLGDIQGGIIATMQGFFVQTDNDGGTSETLTFDNASRTKGGTFYGKRNEKEGKPDFVRFELNGENLYNSAWVSFPQHGSISKIIGDALELYPFSEEYALLATRKGDEMFDIGQFPDDEKLEIPIYIETTRSGSFTLTATDLKISNSRKLLFTDREKDVTIPIDESFKYQFTHESLQHKSNPSASLSCGMSGSELARNFMPKKVTKAKSSSERFVITLAESSRPDELPASIELHQNYPNPFNPTTQIAFELPRQSEVLLEIYDITGRKVATLVNDVVSAGSHSVPFNASNLSSGVYIYKLNVGSTVLTNKLTLIK